MFERYGITGLPTEDVVRGGLTQQSVTGWTAWGRQNSNPQFQDPLVQDWRVNYSTIVGTHTLKTGYEYQRINTAVDDVHPKYGSDTYGGQFSRPAGAAADPATYNLADFMFGRGTSTTWSTRSSSTCGSGCTSATCRTTGASTRR
jgi:hypothetical protein